MPTSTGKADRPHYDREGSPAAPRQDEPRDFETQVSDHDRNYDAPIDPNTREPMDAEDINTHGSER